MVVVLAKVDAERDMGGFGGLLCLVMIDSGGPAKDSVRYQVNIPQVSSRPCTSSVYAKVCKSNHHLTGTSMHITC
jgi:hypothetical protein